MKRLLAILTTLLILSPIPAYAIGSVNVTKQLIIPRGATLPTRCTDGSIAYDTNATSGARLYACETTTWVLQGAGLGSGATSLGDLSNVGGTTATAGRLLVADGLKFSSVAISGDATVTSAGVVAIQANSIDENMLNETNGAVDGYCLTYDQASDSFKWQDCDQGVTEATSLVELSDVNSATATSGSILIADGAGWNSTTSPNFGSAKFTAGGDLDVGGTLTTGGPDDMIEGVTYGQQLDFGTNGRITVAAAEIYPGLGILSDVGNVTATAGKILIGDGDTFESVSMSGDVTITSAGVTTVTTDVFDNGNITYVPFGGDINTYITAATAGDTLVLAAGTYTITSALNVSKSLRIIGQGIGSTTIANSTASIKMFNITASNVLVSNLSISDTGNGSTTVIEVYAFYVDGTAGTVLTNVNFENVKVDMSGTGIQQAIIWLDAGGFIKNSILNVTSTNDTANGIYLQSNDTTAEAAQDVYIYNTEITITSGSTSGDTSIGVRTNDVENNSMTRKIHIFNSSIIGVETGTSATMEAVRTGGARAQMYIYNSLLNTPDIDYTSNSSAEGINEMLVYGTTTRANAISGAPFYKGTVVSKDLYLSGSLYGAGMTATAGNLLIGDATEWKGVALSGDATITSAGVLAIADNAVQLSELGGLGGATATSGNIIYADGAGFNAATLGSMLPPVTTTGDTACSTQCGSLAKCVKGLDVTTVKFVDCANAAADSCICTP